MKKMRKQIIILCTCIIFYLFGYILRGADLIYLLPFILLAIISGWFIAVTDFDKREGETNDTSY